MTRGVTDGQNRSVPKEAPMKKKIAKGMLDQSGEEHVKVSDLCAPFDLAPNGGSTRQPKVGS
jgi:hypothetical protein